MPALNCACGRRLGFGEIPNPIEFLLISETDYDAYSGLVDSEELYRKMASMLKCPTCGRLWIFWQGFAYEPKAYLPE